jgi:hypothetical protein
MPGCRAGCAFRRALAKMILSAKFPPALQLTVTQFLPSVKEVYDSEDRPVYASLGFTFTPRPAAATPPK